MAIMDSCSSHDLSSRRLLVSSCNANSASLMVCFFFGFWKSFMKTNPQELRDSYPDSWTGWSACEVLNLFIWVCCFSGSLRTNCSIFSNWCTRKMPRMSRPKAAGNSELWRWLFLDKAQDQNQIYIHHRLSLTMERMIYKRMHYPPLEQGRQKPCGKVAKVNGNFRILKWRYLPYIRPI